MSINNWKPVVSLSLLNATQRSLETTMREFEEWVKENPPPPNRITNGWYVVTPQIAEQWLRHNVPGANRQVKLNTLSYYAAQQLSGDWPKTHQSIAFVQPENWLLDGQHRLWSCYLSGSTFPTYVISDVPSHPQLFAYLDNGKPRTPADALQTAGVDGLANLLTQVIKMDDDYTSKAFTVVSVHTRPKMAPIDYLRRMERYPNLELAAKLTYSRYAPVMKLIRHRKVVAFMGMKLMDMWNEDMADDFFEALATNRTSPAMVALRTLAIENNYAAAPQMQYFQLLGNMILAFNAWRSRVGLKKNWTIQYQSEFPRL